MADKGWVQFLLVAVPVMSLVGAWLALRVVDGRARRRQVQEEGDGSPGGARKAGGQCRLVGNATGGRPVRQARVD